MIGVAAKAQLRRSFLYYIERERARQSSPFLHYNDWYDLGYSVTAEKLLDAAQQFDTELVKKRGVPVQSYLIDDGWDDLPEPVARHYSLLSPYKDQRLQSLDLQANDSESITLDPFEVLVFDAKPG